MPGLVDQIDVVAADPAQNLRKAPRDLVGLAAVQCPHRADEVAIALGHGLVVEIARNLAEPGPASRRPRAHRRRARCAPCCRSGSSASRSCCWPSCRPTSRGSPSMGRPERTVCAAATPGSAGRAPPPARPAPAFPRHRSRRPGRDICCNRERARGPRSARIARCRRRAATPARPPRAQSQSPPPHPRGSAARPRPTARSDRSTRRSHNARG